jgi:adenylosuccinate synthase
VTSSHCGIAGVIASGLRPDCLHRIYGIAKVYETYVGNKQFQPSNDPVLEKIQEIGQEIGATTSRKRQCNYLNLDMIINSSLINQVSGIILNKLDILREIGIFRCYHQGNLITFDDENEFKDYIREIFYSAIEDGLPIIFSDNPYSI